MKDERTLAQIHLHAVLRDLEDLCRLDATAAGLVAGRTVSVGFKVAGGPSGQLAFRDGTCTASRGAGGADILLFFGSCRHFNAMVAGAANPIPLKGFTRLGFLTGPFTALTKRLETVMRPSEEDLAEPALRAVHTELSLYAAGFALAEVAAWDPHLRELAATMPAGEIAMEIEDGPSLTLVARDGALSVRKGRSQAPRARMVFSDLEAAFLLLSGRIDSYSCIASERLRLEGFVPMLNVVDKLLFKVAEYLK